VWGGVGGVRWGGGTWGAARARNVGGVLRLIQSGNIRSYATWVLLGSVLLIVAMGIAGGLR
jgi:NADH-quinone oxidoreductase subunit L